MTSLYLYLAALTVTIHVSVPVPSIKHPHQYGLATCTGVFISPNEILTADHCVSESRGFQWAKTYEKTVYPVIIEYEDKNTDLALLKVKTNINHKYVKVGLPIYKIDDVYTVNSGEDIPNTFSKGIVNNIALDPETGVMSIIHSAPIMFGASGSGLFNKHGKLIGINVAKIEGFSEAVDISEVNKFLTKCGR